ncbi:MAG: hypothetical protein K2Q26_15965 [Bdellovibrionales bacterium]|nr:hypothetical protein [Bdellovibrionales bacterium]
MFSSFIDQRVILFCLIICSPFLSESVAETQANDVPVVGPTLPAVDSCKTEFSDVTFADLKSKLESILNEKNKTLVNLDFKTLQAQVDILSEHLLVTDNMDQNEFLAALKKTLGHLNELEDLLDKAKSNAKIIREEHVIPLATMASLKSEFDTCKGQESQYNDIFKQLSRLNKDFTEVQMISPQKILAQKKTINELIEKLEDKATVQITQQSLASHLNFIQNQINTVTSTFRFNTKLLNIATLQQ